MPIAVISPAQTVPKDADGLYSPVELGKLS